MIRVTSGQRFKTRVDVTGLGDILSRKVLDAEGLLNITPIWATEKMDEVTRVRKTDQKYIDVGKVRNKD